MKILIPILIALAAYFAYQTFFSVPSEKKSSTSQSQAKPQSKSKAIEVVVETNLGEFTIELNSEKAPKTVANFLKYVDEGFYNNTLFHRIIPGFMVQGGGFVKGMKEKPTHPPVANESFNGLLNYNGTIAMARKPAADSATSQFFINLGSNRNLNSNDNKPGYAVFGKISDGMDTIEKIAAAATTNLGPYQDVPKEDILILSVSRITTDGVKISNVSNEEKKEGFISGEHYLVLDEPIATSNSNKIEVLEAFSYGCGHCYGIDPDITEWRKQQPGDVDFIHFPAVWNKSMKLYARTYYAAKELNLVSKTHTPLFEAIVVKQKTLSNEAQLADFFEPYGIDKKLFGDTFNSTKINKQLEQAEANTRNYNLASVPEFIINGKYRVNPMRAGGQEQMFALINFLVEKERKLLKL